MLGFSEFIVRTSPSSLSEQTLKTLTLASAAALILRQSALLKQATADVKNRKYIEDKLDRLADSINALSTKTTALGAISWAVAKNKRR